MSEANKNTATHDILRTRMIHLRRDLDDSLRKEANECIRKHLFREWKPVWQCVLIYLNQTEEPSTTTFIHHLLKQGTQVCVPTYDVHRGIYIPSMLNDPDTDLARGKFGIREPRPGSIHPIPREDLDAIFLPGLAFDRNGNRLGYGRGYFDRLCENTRAIKVGLAYHFQIVDAIEPGPKDVPMDMIITDKEIIPCKKS